MERSEILLILFIGMLAIGIAYASGRYDVSKPGNLEIEMNPKLSCSQGDGVTGTCHMINATFGGLKSGINGPGPDGAYDHIKDYKVTNGRGPFAGSGVPHPGSGRVPAAVFPRWVHMQHGNGNWPLWKAGPDATPRNKGNRMDVYIGFDTNNASALWYSLNDEYDYSIDWDYLTSPTSGSTANGGQGISPTILNGTSDQSVGDNVGIDLGPFRFPYGADDENQYWGSGNNIIMGETNTNAIEGLGYIATPGGQEWSDNDGDGIFESPQAKYGPSDNRGPPTFAGCAYGLQPDYSIVKAGTPDRAYNSSEPGRYGYNSGCHGISQSWMTRKIIGANFSRTDSPACTDCHYAVNQTGNFKHRTITAANVNTYCADCHGFAGSTPNLNSTTAPNIKVRNCYECHTTGFKISGTVNTTYGHAGVDCRYCHGHGHNVTIQDVGGSGYGVTCGSGDNLCHGTGAPSPRNVGNVQHGQTTVMKCVDCHVNAPGSSSGHDIRIPRCSNCHNSTGVGNAQTSQPVPNWDSNNAIYHGNANKTCQDCHGVSSPHDNAITASTPSCTQTGCHDGSAPGARNITQVHASGVTGATPLTCKSCHNSVTITYNGTTYYPNASIHSTNDTKLIPFGMSYGNDNMTPQQCILCHNTSAFYINGSMSNGPLNCTKCHATVNAYGVKTLTVHSVNMGKPGAVIDGEHSTGGKNCTKCHSIGGVGYDIDFNATENAAHKNLNSGVSTTLPAENKKCWACHYRGTGEPPSNNQHPYGYDNPRTCEECHTTGLFGAPKVYEHYKNGQDIKVTGADCWNCHSLPENLVNNNDNENPDYYTNVDKNKSYASHYTKPRNDALKNLKGERYCGYCHQQHKAGTYSTQYNAYFVDKNRTIQPDHSSRLKGFFATCMRCHGFVNNLHASGLKKPTYSEIKSQPGCYMCHLSLISGTHTNNMQSSGLDCEPCHVGTTGKLHNVSYLQNDGVSYKPAKVSQQQKSYATCYTCHVDNKADATLSSYGLTAKKVPFTGHGDGVSSSGTVYWTDNRSACVYCHADEHNQANPLGIMTAAASVSSPPNTDPINASISSGTTWCGSCHLSSDTSRYYVEMAASMDGKKLPPLAPSDSNHTGSTDQECAGCHYAGSLTDGMDAFMHSITTK